MLGTTRSSMAEANANKFCRSIWTPASHLGVRRAPMISRHTSASSVGVKRLVFLCNSRFTCATLWSPANSCGFGTGTSDQRSFF